MKKLINNNEFNKNVYSKTKTNFGHLLRFNLLCLKDHLLKYLQNIYHNNIGS